MGRFGWRHCAFASLLSAYLFALSSANMVVDMLRSATHRSNHASTG